MKAIHKKQGTVRRDPVMRAFEVFSWMADSEKSSWGLREISRGTGMHASTVHRILSNLVTKQLVQKNDVTGEYHLGLEYLRLAIRTVAREPILEIAQPILQELAAMLGESTLLVAYDPIRQAMVPLLTIESAHPVRSVLRLGDYGPITVGSTGLAILAWLPEATQQDVLSRQVIPLTDHTPTDPEIIRILLRQVRVDGYAITVGQRTQGTAGISAPILGFDDRVCGAITVVFPIQRYEPAQAREYGSLVKASADRVSCLLRGNISPR